MGNPTEGIVGVVVVGLEGVVVGDGPPVGIIDGVGYRVFTADVEGLHNGTGISPTLVEAVFLAGAVFITDAEPIDDVALGVGHAPRHGVGETDDDTRCAGQRCAHAVGARTMKLYDIPQGRQ